MSESDKQLAETMSPGFPIVAVKKRDPRYGKSEEQMLFVKNSARGFNPTVAARMAGYANPKLAGHRLIHKDWVRQAIAIERALYVRASGMSKAKVMQGILDAINRAVLAGEPMTEISGWREVAKMCGYYEPVKHKLEVDVRGHIVVQKLQGMSDADLLKLAEGDESVIDAEFSVLGPENDDHESPPGGPEE